MAEDGGASSSMPTHLEVEVGEDEAQSEPLLGKGGASKSSLSPATAKVLEYLERHAGEGGVLQTLYGRLPRQELPRIAWLSSTLFVIIGGFWMLDSLKDTVLERTVGLEYQPRAKLSSVVVIILLVAQYNKLIDTVRKPVLFYTIGAFYSVLFVSVALVLGSSRGGLESGSPWKLPGWVSYVAIESYGSLAVALFWAFTNATVDLEEAESSYGLIIAGAQVGAILGSTAATLPHAFEGLRVWHLYLAGATSPALMAMMVFFYVRMFEDHVPKEQQWRSPIGVKASNSSSSNGGGSSGGSNSSGGGGDGRRTERSAGIWESSAAGLRLILKHHYVLLVCGISCLYEVVLTVLDYEFKLLGVIRLRNMGGDTDQADEKFATMMGHFGQATNSLSLFLSLFGTSYVVRKLGVSLTLRIFPSLMLAAVLLSYFRPSLGTLFACVAMLKGLNYALNEPCKEMLYVPTSDAVKFKAKAWIDVFGSRCAKGIGSFITESTRGRPGRSATAGQAVYRSMASFLISLVLLVLSVDVGKHFDRLLASGQVVGDEGGEERNRRRRSGGGGGGGGSGGGNDPGDDDAARGYTEEDDDVGFRPPDGRATKPINGSATNWKYHAGALAIEAGRAGAKPEVYL